MSNLREKNVKLQNGGYDLFIGFKFIKNNIDLIGKLL